MKILHFFTLVIIGIDYSSARLLGKLQARIVSGYMCDTTETPYLVLMETVNPQSRCGGSLITYDWVLTASHCIRPTLVQGGPVKISSGFDMPAQFRQVRNAKEFHMHPKFVEEDFLKAKDYRYDIALVLVDKPFSQSVSTHVATLSVPGFAKQCKRVMSPGTGLTYNQEFIWSKPVEERPVKCVDLRIVDTNTCEEDFERGHGKKVFDDAIMCMHEPGKGPCTGDSGGPVLCDNVVIGIVSTGPSNCELTKLPTSFTMVEKYLDFIEKFTGKKLQHVRLNGTSAKKG